VAHAASATLSRCNRAGCTILSLLARPLCAATLRAHVDGSLGLFALRKRVDGPSPASLRREVIRLREIGALERHALKRMPYTVENELTDAGRGILAVADTVDAWLARAPQGAIALGSEPASGAIKALVGSWDSAILHEFAVRPLSHTELNDRIPGISFPSLGRRLAAMRATGQIDGVEEDGSSKPYAVTEWTRQATGPLIAAGRCEREHLTEITEPMTRLDIEAALLLAVPLVSCPESFSGSCLLVVDTGENVDLDGGVEGVHVEVKGGHVVSCVPRLARGPRTWALGVVEAWVEAILDSRYDGLRIGGDDPQSVPALMDRLHVALSPA